MTNSQKRQVADRMLRLDAGLQAMLMGLVEIRDQYIEGEAGRKVALAVTNLEQGSLWLESAATRLEAEIEQEKELTKTLQ